MVSIPGAAWFYEYDVNCHRGVRGDQIAFDEEQFSSQHTLPLVNSEKKAIYDAANGGQVCYSVPQLTMANWFDTVTPYERPLSLIAKSSNIGTITVTNFSADVTDNSQAISGVYRLICAAGGDQETATFHLIAPNGIRILDNFSPGIVPLSITNRCLGFVLDLTADVSIDDEWLFRVYVHGGTWTRRGNSIYIKKTNTLVANNAALPGDANDIHWALLVDGSNGAKGQDISSNKRQRHWTYR